MITSLKRVGNEENALNINMRLGNLALIYFNVCRQPCHVFYAWKHAGSLHFYHVIM